MTEDPEPNLFQKSQKGNEIKVIFPSSYIIFFTLHDTIDKRRNVDVLVMFTFEKID